MTWRKRLFDLFFAGLLVFILGPVILLLCVYVLLKQGRPLFYVAKRMKTPDQEFGLWKFRTMSVVSTDAGGVGRGQGKPDYAGRGMAARQADG